MKPAPLHRHQKNRSKQNHEGTLLAFTVVRHMPTGFPPEPRTIGLIELGDGNKIIGRIIVPLGVTPEIGMNVLPTMRLSEVNAEGLRRYDICYRIPEGKTVHKEFPGYILALTGPSGVGKTTVSILLSTKIGEYVERVPILTTRIPKEGDQDEYIHIDTEEFLRLRNKGKLAASTHIPSSDEERHYGYRRKDIEAIWKKGKVPVVITEMHLLQGLADHFGRRSILSFGLLPPGRSKRQKLSSLLHRLRSRGRDSEQQIEDRLRNAESDLRFFEDRSELFDHLIVNDNLETVISHMQGIVVHADLHPETAI